MYGMFTCIYHKFGPNVDKYTIHGSYGYTLPYRYMFHLLPPEVQSTLFVSMCPTATGAWLIFYKRPALVRMDVPLEEISIIVYIYSVRSHVWIFATRRGFVSRTPTKSFKEAEWVHEYKEQFRMSRRRLCGEKLAPCWKHWIIHQFRWWTSPFFTFSLLRSASLAVKNTLLRSGRRRRWNIIYIYIAMFSMFGILLDWVLELQ